MGNGNPAVVRALFDPEWRKQLLQKPEQQQDPVFADSEVGARYKTQRRTGVQSGQLGQSSLGASPAKTLLGQ